MKNEAEKERKREGLGRGLRTRSDQRTHIGLPTVFWPAEEAWFRSLRCRRRRRSLCRCEVWSSQRTTLRWCRFCGERGGVRVRSAAGTVSQLVAKPSRSGESFLGGVSRLKKGRRPPSRTQLDGNHSQSSARRPHPVE